MEELQNFTNKLQAILEKDEMNIEVARKIVQDSDDGEIAILNTAYVKSQPEEEKLEKCPFADICGENRKLMAPKSISIFGQTGWTTAYSEIDQGGGGLMA